MPNSINISTCLGVTAAFRFSISSEENLNLGCSWLLQDNHAIGSNPATFGPAQQVSVPG
jgi:hypothetical protein